MRIQLCKTTSVALVGTAICLLACHVHGQDWPMFGRDATRNAVSPERNAPTSWDPESGGNIAWSAKLGTNTLGDPVIAEGLVWVGTNNYLNATANGEHDASVLMCFRERDGSFLYRYVSPRLRSGQVNDWPTSSMACSPLIEGDRMWFTTNRCETVCLDIGPLQRGEGKPKPLWKVDMALEFGVFPIGAPMALVRFPSIVSYKNFIYVMTGNGFDRRSQRVPSPRAPNLVCFEKNAGKLMWWDRSPNRNMLYGEWGTPLVVEINGQGQVVTPQGDGWIRSFDAVTGKLLRMFDGNPKESRWHPWGTGERKYIMSSPVFYDNRVYIANGIHPSDGDNSAAWLYCLDPTKQGDISAELATDVNGNSIPHRRELAVDPNKGEKAIPNPNSGLLWRYGGVGAKGRVAFGSTMSNVAVHDGLVIVPTANGFVHCLDSQTGRHYWAHDTLANIYGSPLIVDGKVYIGDDDGDVYILELSRQKNLIGDVHMPSEVNCSPVYANGVLYVASRHRLYAIAGKDAVQQPGPSLRPSAQQIRVPKAIFTPTPQDVVERMLELARVQKTDQVCDLGSGDGRIVITAARVYGCETIGYERDPRLVEISRQRAKETGVESLVRIEPKNIFAADLSAVDVVTLYLLPVQNERLIPQLQKLKPGSRIVAHDFPIPGVAPDKMIKVQSSVDQEEHTLYLWTTPLEQSQQ